MQKEPDPSTLRLWLRIYEEGGYCQQAFVDQHRGPGPRDYLTPEEHDLHLTYAMRYASSTKPSKKLLYSDLEADLAELNKQREAERLPRLRMLGRRSFEKMIDRLDPLAVCAGREGSDAARKKFRAIRTGLEVEKPGEQLEELSSWMVPLQALFVKAGVWELLQPWQQEEIKRIRVWLGMGIDARTRVAPTMVCIVGSPSAATAIATLEMAVMDKSRIQEAVGAVTPGVHCSWRDVVTDSGPAFANYDFQSSVLAIGSNPVLPQAGRAEMRGRIERLFLTLRTKIAARFDGQTFANIIEKGDYNSGANASLNVDELNRVFLRGVLDLYNNTPHEGLAGETPMNCWRRLSHRFPVSPEPPQDIRRNAFGIPAEAKIQSKGIRFAGIHYNSPALQELRRRTRKKPVKIRVDRFDLSVISVWDDGWLNVFANHAKRLEGVSYVEWREAVRHLRARHAEMAEMSRDVVFDAIRDLNDTAEMVRQRARLASTVLSEEQFRKDEADVFRSFTLRYEGDEEDDVLDDALGEMPYGPHSAVITHDQFEAEPRTASDLRDDDLDDDDDDEDFLDDGDEGFGDTDDWATE